MENDVPLWVLSLGVILVPVTGDKLHAKFLHSTPALDQFNRHHSRRAGAAAEVEPVEMKLVDYVKSAAHRKHRGEWTTLNEPIMWLSIHYA